MFLKGVDGHLRGPGQAGTPIRVTACVVAITVALAASGSAQMFGPAPPAAQQGGPPCMAEFVPLRQEAEKRAAKIKAAAERKAGREELCGLFKNFYEAEAKVVKFLETKQTACGIPVNAVTESTANHKKTALTEQRVCSAEGALPRGTGLSEALGVRAVPTPETTKSGKGIFDTLSGTTPPEQ
ncbi:MAG TPA: hypothetical protein VK281_02965 [Xanthobacteraceae bacterium]|nr:hypothetical protein [Xanthobacteraceae bacterium]